MDPIVHSKRPNNNQHLASQYPGFLCTWNGPEEKQLGYIAINRIIIYNFLNKKKLNEIVYSIYPNSYLKKKIFI